MKFRRKINHIQGFNEFSKTEVINLKMLAQFYKDAIYYHPGHLQPKTPMYTLRALVE